MIVHAPRRSVVLSDFHLRKILRECSAHRPLEACGLLLGRTAGELWLVDDIKEVCNNSSGDRRTSYQITEESYQGIAAGGQSGQDIVGVYHSHPSGPAMPSETDLENAVPNLVYLIAGFPDGRGDVSAWLLDESSTRFNAVRLSPITSVSSDSFSPDFNVRCSKWVSGS